MFDTSIRDTIAVSAGDKDNTSRHADMLDAGTLSAASNSVKVWGGSVQGVRPPKGLAAASLRERMLLSQKTACDIFEQEKGCRLEKQHVVCLLWPQARKPQACQATHQARS